MRPRSRSAPRLPTNERRPKLLWVGLEPDAMSGKETVKHLGAMRKRHQEVANTLREHEPLVSTQPHRMKYEVWKFGVALHEWCADWYARLAKDLESGKEAKK